MARIGISLALLVVQAFPWSAAPCWVCLGDNDAPHFAVETGSCHCDEHDSHPGDSHAGDHDSDRHSGSPDLLHASHDELPVRGALALVHRDADCACKHLDLTAFDRLLARASSRPSDAGRFDLAVALPIASQRCGFAPEGRRGDRVRNGERPPPLAVGNSTVLRC